MKMEIKIQINEGCKHCKEALKYFDKLHKQNKKAYAGYILHPISKFVKRGRDLGEEDRIKGLLLRPDYNSLGHLTHFHIEKEGEKNE